MSTSFVFRCATQADLPIIRTLCANEVVSREPTCSYLGLSTETFMTLYDELLRQIDLDMSIIAEEITPNHRQGRVVGCILATPFDAAVDEKNVDPICAPIMEILHSLEVWFQENILHDAGIPAGRVLTAMLAATESGYTGRGLLSRMLQSWNARVLKLGKWDMTVAECTSPFSRRACFSMGWKEGNVINYQDFTVDRKKPFAELEGEAALVYRDLRPLRTPSARL